MTRSLIICIFLAVTAAAQKPQSAPSKQAPAPPAATPSSSPSGQSAPPSLMKRDEKPAQVPPNQPVINIRGLCPADTNVATNSKVPSTGECSTSITKEQFDS